MAVDEMVIKFGIDSSNFEGGLTKINSGMKLLQSEFKASSQGLEGFGNDTQKLANKSEYLNKAIELQKLKVKQLQESYNKSKTETGEFSKSTMDAGVKVNNAVSYLAKMENELKQVDSQLEKAKKSSDETGGAFSKLGEKVKSAFSGMGEYIKRGIGLAIGGDIWDKAKEGFTSIVTFSSDLKVALNGLQSSTGATDKEMSALKQTMVDIYNDNFGEGFEDISNSLATVKQQTGASGEELKKMTENALLLRDTFDMDVTESVRSANMLMQQFGMTSDEAYNYIAQGAQNGLDKNGDLLDSINEYSVHFKQLGLDADDMFNMLSNGAKSGTFSVDKLGDAVKEFGIRVKDGTADESFKQLGLSVDETKNKFGQGGEVTKEALKNVTTALFNMKDPIQQNNIGVQLFGTMWEDLGAKGVSALTNMNGSINGTKDVLNSINQVKYNDIGSAFEGIKRNIETSVLVPIGDKMLPKLNELGQWFKTNMPTIKTSFSNAFDQVSPILDGVGVAFTLLLSNINLVIPVVATLGSAFATLKMVAIVNNTITSIKNLKNNVANTISTVKTLGANLKMAATNALNFSKNIATGTKNLASNAWKSGTTIIKNIGTAMLNGAKAAGTFALNLGKTALAFAKNAIQAGIATAKMVAHKVATLACSVATKAMSIAQGALNLVMSLNPIGLIIIGITALIATIVLLWNKCEWFRNAIKVFFEVNKIMFQALCEALKVAWEGFKIAFKAVCDWLKPYIEVIWNAIKTTFEIVVNALKTTWEGFKVTWTTVAQAISTTWNTITNAIRTVWTTICVALSTAWNTFKSGFDTVTNGISSAWAAVTGKITSVWDSVCSKVRSAWEGIKAPFKSVVDWIGNIWQGIKSKFKLPHFTVSGSLNPLKWGDEGTPSIGVQWYAKGGIMTDPTVFGMNGANAMVGGEAGEEAILPLDGFYKNLDDMLNDKLGSVIDKIGNRPVQITTLINVDGRQIAKATSRYMDEELAFNSSRG